MPTFNPTLMTFSLYIIVTILIGFFAYLRTHNFSDYILGGRKIGSFITAMSAGASDMSGWLLMGLPGAIYLSGLAEAWIAIGLVIGAWLNWYYVAGRLRIHTEHNHNALTLPEYFHYRFQDKTRLLRIVSASIILCFFTVYCASGVVAGARLFESLFEISYSNALWIGALATITYTFIGGFLAVSWTDTLQASLMIFALLITPIIIILSLGGWEQTQILIQTQHADSHYFNLFSNLPIIGIISAMAWGLGYFGQPHILARFMAANSVTTLQRARKIGMTWMILCLSGAIAVGLFGIAFFTDHPELATNVNQENERIFIELTTLLFNPWIAGILLSAIFAAIMSTLSCQLLVCSSAITEDFYKNYLRPTATQQELVWIGRTMVLVIACLAIAIARDPQSKVLDLVAYAWAGFGASFGPVVILSLYWKKMTDKGALAGMITGTLVVILWKQIGVNHTTLTAIYEIIPGFISATLMIMIVSLFTKASAQQQAVFTTANQHYHQQSKEKLL